MKIILAGTPNFSVDTFEKIILNFDVIGIIAQPDRKIGRKQVLTSPPTVELAKKYKIKIYQPEKILDIYEELKLIEFDIFLTMAYGQIIPTKILNLANIGSFNIHASLLPKYRGAAPIQYCLLNGDTKTGITLMEMIDKMDAGDIYFQAEIDIIQEDNYDSLLTKLSFLSTKNIVNWLNLLRDNKFNKIKQDEKLVSFAPKILKEHEIIEFGTMNNTINKIRSLSSNPGAYILDKKINKRIKIFKATKDTINTPVVIECSDGNIYAQEYQIEGKKKVILN